MKHIFEEIYHEDFTSNPSASALMAYALRELKTHNLIEGGRSRQNVGSWINNYSITEKGRHILKKAILLENFLYSQLITYKDYQDLNQTIHLNPLLVLMERRA